MFIYILYTDNLFGICKLLHHLHGQTCGIVIESVTASTIIKDLFESYPFCTTIYIA